MNGHLICTSQILVKTSSFFHFSGIPLVLLVTLQINVFGSFCSKAFQVIFDKTHFVIFMQHLHLYLAFSIVLALTMCSIEYWADTTDITSFVLKYV